MPLYFETKVMESQVRDIASKLLHDSQVLGVLGLRAEHRHVGPHVFTTADDLATLVLEPPYGMALICMAILDGSFVVDASAPEKRIEMRTTNASRDLPRLGVVVRGCDERALIEMAKLGQVDLNRLVLIGLACSEAQARECMCARPYPRRIDVGEKVAGVAPAEDARVRGLLERDVEGRMAFWQQEFDRCIKCYGCRNVCPVCICDACVLEPPLASPPPAGGIEGVWVERGKIPPELPFHLIRAYHIADKCILCGACEAACPVDIPLTTLYALLQERLKGLFGYEPGLDVTQKSPLTTPLEETPLHEL